MLIQNTFNKQHRYSVLHVGQLILAVAGHPKHALNNEMDEEVLLEWTKSTVPNRKTLLAMQISGYGGDAYFVSSIDRAIAELSHLMGIPLEISKRLPPRQPISVTTQLHDCCDPHTGESCKVTAFVWRAVYLGSLRGDELCTTEALQNSENKHGVANVDEAMLHMQALVDAAICREYQPDPPAPASFTWKDAENMREVDQMIEKMEEMEEM